MAVTVRLPPFPIGASPRDEPIPDGPFPTHAHVGPIKFRQFDDAQEILFGVTQIPY